MGKSLNSLRFEISNQILSETHETSKCNVCNEEFEAPLFTVISSGYLLEEYYACPRCLSKVGNIERNKAFETEENKCETEEVQEIAIKSKPEETVTCLHRLGYLKHRPKNTPIPEECLTCIQMIECMT